MKVWVALSSLVVLGVLAAGPGPAPAETAADPLCPRAVPKLDSFAAAAKADDADKLAQAAKETADAYRVCMSEARITGPIEPRYNYDEFRAAYFMAVEGRALVVLHKPADATAAFRDARSLANEVAVWKPDANMWSGNNASGTASGRNGDLRPSQYHDGAVQIRTVAETELGNLGQDMKGAPGPASSAAPH